MDKLKEIESSITHSLTVAEGMEPAWYDGMYYALNIVRGVMYVTDIKESDHVA